MPFTGKATFAAGVDLPELVEDVSDIISIVSPYETPLLDHLGDGGRAAANTIHEWLEDSLLPNVDLINQTTFSPNATSATSITVDNGARFRVGDMVRPEGLREVMFVSAIAGNVLTVVRAYGGTTAGALADNMKLTILGNAALEGDDRPATRFTNRIRKRNYTQIFTASVEVSGSMRSAASYGLGDEMDFQKQERARELIRDLENCVLGAAAATTNPQGNSTTRRTMAGIIPSIVTNQFTVNSAPIPPGGGGSLTELTEPVLNAGLRAVWEGSNGPIDTIVVNGAQKRRINEFISSTRRYEPSERRMSNLVSVYESDFGVCRVILSRWMPTDSILFLDSSRIQVLPLAGRSFHFKPLASTGDSEVGQLIGEYTVEFRNENAHGILRGLAA